MKRAIFLATAAFLAMLILVPMALAQDGMVTFPGNTVIDGTTIMYSGVGGGTTISTFTGGRPGPTPTTGGPAMLLPVATLLLGSDILTYAILRRR
jgi:hypothetical protein